MALADRTRLRVLNLMRDEEVCVCFFTEVLGDSQPKISRHLAFLRKAGIVTARREGKWVHYSISRPADDGARNVLGQLFGWMDGREDLRADRERYKQVCCSPEMLDQLARTPITFISPGADMDSPEPNSTYNRSYNELEEFLL